MARNFSAHEICALAGAMLLSLGVSPHIAQARAPDFAACTPQASIEEGVELEREIPLPIPRGLEGIATSDFLRIAVSTLDGGTVCVPTGDMDGINGPVALFDGRFLGIPWAGYETGGYMLVDRMGKGSAIEIGAPPSFSPFMERIASVEGSGSGFGSLNGVLVLAIGESGLSELARIEDLPEGHDWKVEGWSDTSCFEISSLPLEASDEWPPRRLQAVSEGSEGWHLGPVGSHCPAP